MTTKRKPGSHDSIRLECVIHYPTLQTDHTELTPLNDTSYSTFLLARDIRKELGGEHYHADQCTSIPTPQYDDSIHGIHRRCYQKFTKAKSLLKRKHSSDGDEGTSYHHLRTESACASPRQILLPVQCGICEKYMIK